MKLKDILKGIKYEFVSDGYDLEINKIAYDSRKVEKGDLFVCIEGYNVDGHKFIASAVEKGAAAVLFSKQPEDISVFKGTALIKTEDTRKGLAVCAANYYENPSKKLKIIGITGTSGKTTSTFLMKYILEEAGFKVGLIGTIQNYIGDRKIPSSRTTPESLELQQMFSEMVKNGLDYCVMEVSSHSLYLNRVYGIEFSQGIFTNLSQDHLDFHKTFENYFQAKLLLFKSSKNLIVNVDDEYGKRILKDIDGKKLTYGVSNLADITADNVRMHSKGIDFDIVYGEKRGSVSLNLPGKYNIYNALCSAAACINEGIPFEVVVKGLSDMPGVPGRCELVSKNYNIDYDIIIDYAHAPAELENILKTVREFTKGRLITVFGCGGDRDKTKRAEMGQIGTRLSDKVIITSDNPRSEEPIDIINDIVKGIESNNYTVIEDRRAAIKKAIEIAGKDDVIVIAGKGHEDYQELKNGKIHFDEREVISDIFKAINC